MAPKEAAVERHIEGLPLSVVGPVDLGRLTRELEAIENNIQALRIRRPDEEVKLPKTSRMMDEITSLNKLDLLQTSDRKDLKRFLATVRDSAPRLHMSFSADPSPLFTSKIMAWLREQIHPVVLLTIGLQPGIGAGCVVRTPNKYFDLSLSKDFAKNRDLLMTKLREAPDVKPAQPAVAAPVAAAKPITTATPQTPAAAVPQLIASTRPATSQPASAGIRTVAAHAKEIHA